MSKCICCGLLEFRAVHSLFPEAQAIDLISSPGSAPLVGISCALGQGFLLIQLFENVQAMGPRISMRQGVSWLHPHTSYLVLYVWMWI